FQGGSILSSNQHATCKFDFKDGSNEVINFDTRADGYRAGGHGEQNGIKVFAGVRSDPWFLDLARTVKFNNAQQVSRGPGVNGLWGTNVLTIAVEVDKSRLISPVIAVTAQTVRK